LFGVLGVLAGVTAFDRLVLGGMTADMTWIRMPVEPMGWLLAEVPEREEREDRGVASRWRRDRVERVECYRLVTGSTRTDVRAGWNKRS